MNCPLCQTVANKPFFNKDQKLFYRCGTCDGIYRDKHTYLAPKDEHKRYENHNNDVTDIGYQNFVMPLVDQVVTNFDANHHLGLDYGAGPGPVITKLLKDKGFSLKLYDPYFWPDATVFDLSYDFIVCCEVIEHFNSPVVEFKRLRNLLRPKGQLICKTSLYNDQVNFETWYYKNDPTHVFLYTAATLDWIAKNIGFEKMELNEKLIVFGI
ncbi:MAG: class I SAM-dependent methyltransferase [Gilvibacter sp.]